MDITRHNYEEYFILYVDHELNAAECHAVEEFVQQNPDLEEELIMLQQSVLRPDEKLVFAHKENLMKDTARQGLVNENNYAEYFVLYSDDELTNEEKDLVEQFVYKYPQYQVEFELIQQARLFPDQSISFPDKAFLYRTEEDDHKVVPFAWWRMAAAAIFLIAVGSLGLYITFSDTNPTDGAPVVKTPTDLNNTKNVAVINKDEKEQPAVAKADETKNTDDKSIGTTDENNQEALAKDNNSQPAIAFDKKRKKIRQQP